jgi:hypothetical protein
VDDGKIVEPYAINLRLDLQSPLHALKLLKARDTGGSMP